MRNHAFRIGLHATHHLEGISEDALGNTVGWSPRYLSKMFIKKIRKSELGLYIYIYIKSKPGIYQPENLMSNGSSRHDDAAQTK